MTVCAAVLLDDGRVYCATDAAVGYAGGYRRPMVVGTGWDDFKDQCLIRESGSDLALARVRAKMVEHKKSPKLADARFIAQLVREVQDEVKGTEGVDSIECELLHVSFDGLIHVVGGDGGVVGPYPYTAIGPGGTPVNPIFDYDFPKKAKITERIARDVVKRAFAVCPIFCDSVPGFFQTIY